MLFITEINWQQRAEKAEERLRIVHLLSQLMAQKMVISFEQWIAQIDDSKTVMEDELKAADIGG